MTDYSDLFVPIETTQVPSKISVAWRVDPDGFWHEPDVDDAAHKLRRIYENYSHYSEQAAKSAEIIRKRWTYEQTGTALAAVIESARSERARTVAADELDREEMRRRHQVAVGG